MSWRTSSRIWRTLILISRNLFKFGERQSYLTLKFWFLKKPKGWTFIAIFFEIKQNPYTPIFGLVGIGVGEISEWNFWIFAQTLFHYHPYMAREWVSKFQAALKFTKSRKRWQMPNESYINMHHSMQNFTLFRIWSQKYIFTRGFKKRKCWVEICPYIHIQLKTISPRNAEVVRMEFFG